MVTIAIAIAAATAAASQREENVDDSLRRYTMAPCRRIADGTEKSVTQLAKAAEVASCASVSSAKGAAAPSQRSIQWERDLSTEMPAE